MKEFTIEANSYLRTKVKGFYNCDYVGYQKSGNPDFINHLKNMTRKSSELDLVKDFIAVFERASADLKELIENKKIQDVVIVVAPRSKAEKHYKQSQLMFQKAISCVADKIGCTNGANVIKR